MKVEVLASVMNASLPETVQHMNLQSDAVIINQCDRLGQEEMQISPCLLYTSPSPRDTERCRMPSSA